MKYVEIYRLGSDYKQTVVATCELSSGNLVTCEGEPLLVASLLSDGVINETRTSDQPEYYQVTDGISFLEQLSYNFKSGYLNASKVLEK